MLKRLFASRKRPYIPGRYERETIEIDFSGSLLRLEMPPHHDYEGFPGDPFPDKVNIYDQSQYDGVVEKYKERHRQQGYSTWGLGRRTFELFGPIWLERPVGTIGTSIVLFRADIFTDSMSCFNPNHFEQLLVRNLYFAGPLNPTMGHLKAPVNWQTRSVNSSTCIYMEAHKDFEKYEAPPPPHTRPLSSAAICVYLWKGNFMSG